MTGVAFCFTRVDSAGFIGSSPGHSRHFPHREVEMRKKNLCAFLTSCATLIFCLHTSALEAQAVNGNCWGAELLQLGEGGQITIQGDTSDGATLLFDFPMGGCVIDTVGLWYAVEGTGDWMGASSCGRGDFTTKLGIIASPVITSWEQFRKQAPRGPPAPCPFFTTVVNNCAADSIDCSDESTVQWESEQGRLYIIRVQSRLINDFGAFSLTVESENNVVAPENAICLGAEPINLNANGRAVVEGSTVLGRPFEQRLPGCPIGDAPGVWYSLVGTGSALRGAICGTDYAANLSVFSGSCNNLRCIDTGTTIQRPCDNSEVQWDAVAGVNYLILVHGFGGTRGNYNMRIMTEGPLPPDNDGDGVPNDVDNCVDTVNPNQIDRDGDGVGDVCDASNNTDNDGDGVPDVRDNCVDRANPDQADLDGDGIGDACEPDDGRQVPSDFNQDSQVNISDAVSFFGFLFLGQDNPACYAGLDFNGDNSVNLSDGIGTLNYLFQGGPQHALGTGCLRIDGCPEACAP